jgi:hypothetical protein
MTHLLEARKLFGAEVLPGGFSHCAGPYGIVVDGFLRVFFTSRMYDGAGLVSQPFFIDIDLSTFSLLGPANPILLPKAEPGSYREHGIFPFSVYETQGEYLIALATGWSRRVSVDVETAVGVFFSLDGGVNWIEDGKGPKFSAQRNEPFLVCDVCYLEHNGEFYCAYVFGTDWCPGPNGNLERTYKIGTMKASHFEELTNGSGEQSIPELVKEEVQAYPNLRIDSNGNLEMVFCWRFRENFRVDPKNSYKLAFAKSKDGFTWQRQELKFDLRNLDGAKQMQCYPSYVSFGRETYLLFNGDNFGETGVYISSRL